MVDVVVIGAGIMGAAVSRELSKYELKILLLDKEKLERYRLIIKEYERERKKDLHTVIMVFVLIGFLIAVFAFMASY